MYVNFFDPEVEDSYRRSPKRLEQQVRALPGSVEWIPVDEVQRLDPLLGSQAKSAMSVPMIVSSSGSM